MRSCRVITRIQRSNFSKYKHVIPSGHSWLAFSKQFQSHCPHCRSTMYSSKAHPECFIILSSANNRSRRRFSHPSRKDFNPKRTFFLLLCWSFYYPYRPCKKSSRVPNKPARTVYSSVIFTLIGWGGMVRCIRINKSNQLTHIAFTSTFACFHRTPHLFHGFLLLVILTNISIWELEQRAVSFMFVRRRMKLGGLAVPLAWRSFLRRLTRGRRTR